MKAVKFPLLSFAVLSVFGEVKASDCVSSGEFLVDTSLVYVHAQCTQGYPAVACDGRNCLVVWKDDRQCRGGYNIFGTRVDAEGCVLDPQGIAISITSANKSDPAIIFDGTNYFVVWMDWRNGKVDIYGTRVSTSGIVIDPEGIPIAVTGRHHYEPDVCFDGRSYLVVWSDDRLINYSNADIYGTRVNLQGEVLDPEGIPIAIESGGQREPVVGFDGKNSLVVWSNTSSSGSYYRGIYGVRLDQQGNVLDDPFLISSIAQGHRNPSVAFDGTNYFVVWNNGVINGLAGARVAETGQVLDPEDIHISPAGYPGQKTVCHDGNNFVVAWYQNSDIYVARVTSSGELLDTEKIQVCTYESGKQDPTLAFTGIHNLVVWVDHRDFWDIYGTRVDPSGEVLDTNGVLITMETQRQQSSCVASNGTNYVVAWISPGMYSGWNIHSVLMEPTGTMLNLDTIRVSGDVDNNSKTSASYNGTDFFLAWNNEHIYGARLSSKGDILDKDGIQISREYSWGVRKPSVSFDGENYLVAWQYESDHFSDDIFFFGARVTSGGEVIDLGTLYQTSSMYSYWLQPSVAFDGNNHLLVWPEELGDDYDILGLRLDSQGNVLDPEAFLISSAPNAQVSSIIVFDGTNYLVVWQDGRNGEMDIYGARVSPQAEVLDPEGIPICTAPGDQQEPVADFDGTNYTVVWTDSRNADDDIYGAWVSPEGVVFESFCVTSRSGNQREPAITIGPYGQHLITYTGWTPEPYNMKRIWGKFLYSCGVKCDDNLDGSTDVLDILDEVSIIIGYTIPDSCEFWRADCNDDGEANILDIVKKVNMISGR